MNRTHTTSRASAVCLFLRPARRPLTVLSLMCLVTRSIADPGTADPGWVPSSWHGEHAFVLATSTWRAIVSVERARLVHFGPAEGDANLLFAPAVKDHAEGWGGHRVWLGPQVNWRAIWPPPEAWESRAAERVSIDGACLELVLPAADDGWARFSRVYELADGRLACRVRVQAGGTRAAQVMQIFQVPSPESLEVEVAPSPSFPLGFALLPPARGRNEVMPAFELPAQVCPAAPGRVRLRQTAEVEKLGFPSQSLFAGAAGSAVGLWVGPGRSTGPATGSPDLGFVTQVYLGISTSPLIELEQMSPLFAAGAAAEFTVTLDVASR